MEYDYMYARIFALGFIYLLYYMNSETESPIRPFDKDYNVEEFDDVFELEDKESGVTYLLYKTNNQYSKKAKLSIEGKVQQE